MERITIGNKLSACHVEVGKRRTTKVNLIIGANNQEQVEIERQKIEAGAGLGVSTMIDLSTVRTSPSLW